MVFKSVWYLMDGLLRDTDIYKTLAAHMYHHTTVKSQFSLMVPSHVLIAMNFILSVLETSDGSLRKSYFPETRFLLSDDEFLYPDLSRVFEAWLIPPQGSWQILEYKATFSNIQLTGSRPVVVWMGSFQEFYLLAALHHRFLFVLNCLHFVYS